MMTRGLLIKWRETVERWYDDVQDAIDRWFPRRELQPQVVVVRTR